jgi:putative molybdopterin biosynthesis protein
MPEDQQQFLNVLDRDAAERRWHAAIRLEALPSETIALGEALGRVLAAEVTAGVDVPAFDRSNVDGYALIAEDTYRASENSPRRLRLNDEELATGVVPRQTITAGRATVIATGAILPRGADAVLMVEDGRLAGSTLLATRPVAPGANITFAGTDMGLGELVLRRGTLLTSRETGVLAAIGRAEIPVFRSPRVAIVSTGDEIIAPGSPYRAGAVFDANATLLADATRELGGVPVMLGIVGDDPAALEGALDRGLASADLVIMSGGTSKGAGDVSHRVLSKRTPGIVVHGVALKPGKPICLGAVGAVPVAILPGFPTSAIFTFHEFVAPLLRRLTGLGPQSRDSKDARMAVRINSDRGRTEYVLVNLVAGRDGLSAYPLGKGSGSVTTFSGSDGFVVIPLEQEYVDQGELVSVTMLGGRLEPADLIAIGSHCVGLDALLGLLAGRGFRVKTLWVGSQGGLMAAGRGECDLAGVHLLDPATNLYNLPFLPEGVRLLQGYGRMQGVVHRDGDPRFSGRALGDALTAAIADPTCLMINRNRGSGTRVLTDSLLEGRRPPGWAIEARSHNAVAAAVSQGRADWGLAIETVARQYALEFIPIRAERYDFAIPEDRWERPAVSAFRDLLAEEESRVMLEALGFQVAQGDEPA